MDPVTALLQLGGAATFGQLKAHVNRRDLARALACGRVLRPFRGTYALPTTPAAVAAAVTVGGVVSHASAASLWGCDVLNSPEEHHVTVPANSNRLGQVGVRLHYHHLRTAEFRRTPWPLTSLLRTVVDCARSLPILDAVVIGDSALRLGPVKLGSSVYGESIDWVTIDDVQAVTAGLRGPGARRVRRVLKLLDPKAESILESVFRVLLHIAGFPPPQTQVTLLDGKARVDFLWPDAHVVVEVEGYEFHGTRQAWRSDCRRFNALVNDGLRPLRFTWDDVLYDQEYVIRTLEAGLAKAGIRRLPEHNPRRKGR